MLDAIAAARRGRRLFGPCHGEMRRTSCVHELSEMAAEWVCAARDIKMKFAFSRA